jgi:hypothetical protein
LGELRRVDGHGKDYETGISSYQGQLRDENTFESWYDKYDPLLGYSYLNLVAFPFPRVLLGPYKPVMLDGLVAKRIFNRDDMGMPLHPVTEAYINFGSLGMLVFILFGRLLRYIDNARNTDEYWILVFLVILSSTLFSTYIVYALQVFVVHLFFTIMATFRWR